MKIIFTRTGDMLLLPKPPRIGLKKVIVFVLSQGGRFAFHDLFSVNKYGDMDAFVRKLKDMGYADVQLLDTMDSLILTHKEAGVSLGGSKLLVGRK